MGWDVAILGWDRTGCGETGRDGMGWDGMGCGDIGRDGIGRDGMGCGEMEWDGMWCDEMGQRCCGPLAGGSTGGTAQSQQAPSATAAIWPEGALDTVSSGGNAGRFPAMALGPGCPTQTRSRVRGARGRSRGRARGAPVERVEHLEAAQEAQLLAPEGVHSLRHRCLPACELDAPNVLRRTRTRVGGSARRTAVRFGRRSSSRQQRACCAAALLRCWAVALLRCCAAALLHGGADGLDGLGFLRALGYGGTGGKAMREGGRA